MHPAIFSKCRAAHTFVFFPTFSPPWAQHVVLDSPCAPEKGPFPLCNQRLEFCGCDLLVYCHTPRIVRKCTLRFSLSAGPPTLQPSPSHPRSTEAAKIKPWSSQCTLWRCGCACLTPAGVPPSMHGGCQDQASVQPTHTWAVRRYVPWHVSGPTPDTSGAFSWCSQLRMHDTCLLVLRPLSRTRHHPPSCVRRFYENPQPGCGSSVQKFGLNAPDWVPQASDADAKQPIRRQMLQTIVK